MKKFLSTLAVAGLATFALASCNGGETPTDTPSDGKEEKVDPLAGTTTLSNGDIYLNDDSIAAVNDALQGNYEIKLWVSEVEGSIEYTETVIEKFKAKFPKIKADIQVEGVGEGSAATQMKADVANGADVYAFAQDQIALLVQAEALAPVSDAVKARLEKNNDASSVAASTVGGKMYAYPLTSDNGYFMYYNKEVVDQAHLGDIMAIMDDCQAAGQKFAFNIETNGWYTASVFFGAGCHSNWSTNQKGFFTAVDDDFNSDKGFLAAKAMKMIMNHEAFLDSDKAATFGNPIPSAVVVTGTWDYATAKDNLGDKIACAELPSVTVDGNTFHLGSFSGNKLMGVKPQDGNPNKQAVCQLLAEYLSLGEAQLGRFNALGWGPSNVNAQKNDKIQNDIALKAFAAQSAYATPQGTVNGAWWSIASTLAGDCKIATSDAELRAALEKYAGACNDQVKLTPKQQGTWSAIGAGIGGDWSTDIEIVIPGEDGTVADGTYTIKDVDGTDRVFALAENGEFKLRQGYGWNAQCATVKEGCTYAQSGDNIKVLVAGDYKVEVRIEENKAVWVNLVPVA